MPAMHDLEAWNEAVCDGAWGKPAAWAGEKMRQAVDLEHWAAFRESFTRLGELQRAVGAGERGTPPATILTLSGDVHHAYLAEVGYKRGAGSRAPSTRRSARPSATRSTQKERRVIRSTMNPVMKVLARFLRRGAGVPNPEVRWRQVGDGPWFDNQFATLRSTAAASTPAAGQGAGRREQRHGDRARPGAPAGLSATRRGRRLDWPPRMDYPVESFTDAERDALAPHFTNLDRPVFALVNLPETVKGAMFARYSRYPGTLRRLFLDEFAGDLEGGARAAFDGEEGERARKLYERIFLGYGDDSVAQLGGVHVACEWVSNVMTKVLQRGRLAAYLEQSTRYIAYDQPMPGGGYRYWRHPELGPEHDAGDGLPVRHLRRVAARA